jgi:hypothetical protein
MELNLNTTLNLTVRPAEVLTNLTTVTIQRTVDNPNDKLVRCFIKELPMPVILWDMTTTPSYDTINGDGNWTTEQANSRLIEILSAMK